MTPITTTMKLNHLSFPSTDVAATAGFFERYLGCTAAPFGTSRLLKRPGFDIVIQAVQDQAATWPEDFHLGFEVASLADLQALYDQFKAEGVDLQTDLFAHPRGSRFFCRAPGGLTFELNTRADAAEAHRGSFDN